MNKIYLLYACNLWKEFSSMRVVLATTDKETLYAAAANSIFETEMDYDGLSGGEGLLRFKADYEDDCVDFDKLSYGFVKEHENESAKDSPIATDYSMAYDWLNMDADELFDTINFGKPDLITGQKEGPEDLER